VQHQARDRGQQRGTDRSAATAQVEDHVARAHQPGGLGDEQGCALPGHEYTRVDGDPQAAEVRPAEQLLERHAGDPGGDEPFELTGRSRRRHEQGRFVLGEHTTGSAQPGDQVAVGARAGGARVIRARAGGHRRSVGHGCGYRAGMPAPARRRAYFWLMGACVVLILLAWNVVRLWSTAAAVAMSVVAALIPPVAAIVGNWGEPRGPDDHD
jgi:hypothetical protein